MNKRLQYLSRLATSLLLVLISAPGCGDQVQDVTVSVKTSDKAGAPLRYVQFTLNERGMITNKDGVKKTQLQLKNGDAVKFNLVRLPNGFVLSNPAQRASWNTTFKGDSETPIVFDVVLKPEGEAVAEVVATTDVGVAVAALGELGTSEAEVEPTPTAQEAEPKPRIVKKSKPAASRSRDREVEPVASPVRERRERVVEQDDVLELPPVPSRQVKRPEPEPEPEPEPIPMPEPEPEPYVPAPRNEPAPEPEDDPLLGLEGIDDLEGVDSAKQPEPILPKSVARADEPTPSSNVADDLPPELLMDDVAGGGGGGGGGTMDSSTLARLRTKLDSGGALSAGEIGDLESTPKKPKREFVESRRLLADWYYQNRQWRKQASALKTATETRGPYRRDPMVLLSLAKAYGHLKSYRQASKVMSKVERYGNRLPKEKRADAYRFHAEMLEFQFLQQQRDDPEKANAELIDQAMGKLRKLITFVGSASPQAKSFAKERLIKLEDLKRRVAE